MGEMDMTEIERLQELEVMLSEDINAFGPAGDDLARLAKIRGRIKELTRKRDGPP